MKKDILLEFFGVKSHKELIEYMEQHPEDKKSRQLKEIFEMLKTGEENGEI